MSDIRIEDLCEPRRGPDEQAFVAGVIHRLVESQNLVAWTREALIEEQLQAARTDNSRRSQQ